MQLRIRTVKIRLFLVALGAVMLFVLGSLLFATRALIAADRSRLRIDAAESALLVENFVAVHTKALATLHGVYVAGGDFETADAHIATLADELVGFRRVFLADSAGVVRRQYALRYDGPAMPLLVDLDTITRLGLATLVRQARLLREVRISAPGELYSGEDGIVLLDPVYVRGAFAGFVGGTIVSDSLLAAVLQARELRRAAVTILVGAQAIAAHGQQRQGDVVATAEVDLPGDARWQVRVARQSTTRAVRWGLWTLALATLVALLIGAVRERRTAMRISERSSELERLSSELLRANRAKSEFLANVSHELRTPLNAIVGFVELLRDGVYGDLGPRQVGPVERIEASASHLRHLVDQILDLGKMAAGRLDVHLEPVDLRAFVLDVVSEVEPLITERGLNLSIGVGSTLPRVRTDPTHLRQILVNLIGNAVKYTPDGGLAIRARVVGMSGQSGNYQAFAPDMVRSTPAPNADHPWVAVQVADTGIGIDPADHERIFDEFEQVNAGPRGDSILRGTGLGLAISRRLARLLGGDITVESELGKGATFTLWIAVSVAEVHGRERRPVAETA